MKKVLITCLFILPLVANANTLQFNNAVSHKFNGYNAINANVPTAQAGHRNLGQFGSFSIVGDSGGLFSVAYLANESSDNSKYTSSEFKSDANQDNHVAGVKHTKNVVSVPSALPLLATAVGLFCFGANRRRV